MTPGDQLSETRDCGADAAAYALGALEPAEADAFRRHMETCIVCRDEVVAFQQVVDALPMAAPQQPVPRSLRRKVLRSVRAEPKHRGSAARGWRSIFSGLALPRPALAGGAVLAAVLATIGGVELASTGAGGTRVIQARVGDAEIRLAGGHGELIVRHLQPPPAGRIYEVWLKRGHHAASPTSALFSVTAAGTGEVDVPGNLHGVTQVMVTQEPAGGSLVPTHAPVILAQLA